MKIGVLSDTHIRSGNSYLPGEIFEIFENVDIIFHAGDICIQDVIIELESLAPVVAVAGNMDPYVFTKELGLYQRKKINDKKFLITHGHNGRESTIDNIKNLKAEADCIVFGHSHQPYNERHNDTLLFNPGSPTDYKRSYIKKKKPSVGILTLSDERLEGRIIYLI